MKPAKQSKIVGNKPRIQSSKAPNRSPQILVTQSGKPLKLKANQVQMRPQDFKTENTSDIYMQKLVRPETSGPRQHGKGLQR